MSKSRDRRRRDDRRARNGHYFRPRHLLGIPLTDWQRRYLQALNAPAPTVRFYRGRGA